MKFKIHFFATGKHPETGKTHHWNGMIVLKRSKKPSDEESERLARELAQEYLGDLKKFQFRITLP